MISKVKAQKTRLTNYLVKELGAKVISKSKSTESEYYELGKLKIRISDHTSHNYHKGINIFIPFNDPNTFIIENNYTISVLKSLKEVKAFLHSLIFIYGTYKELLNSDISKELLILQEKVDSLTFENEKFRTLIDHEREGKLDNVISIGGKSYPICQFPFVFVTKIKNVIKSSKIKPI